MEQRWLEDRSRQIFGDCKNCLSDCSYARAWACSPSSSCVCRNMHCQTKKPSQEQVDAVKETWVTVAVVLYLVYGSARVLKVQPQNRLLRLFGVKLLLTMSV